MENDSRPRAALDENSVSMQQDLRPQVSAALLDRADVIATDAIPVLSYSGSEALDADYCRRIGHLLIRLLASNVQDGPIHPRSGALADLQKMLLERALTIERVFTFVYLTERV